MSMGRSSILVCLAILLSVGGAQFARGQTADARTYAAGVSAFDDGAFELAEKYFAEFVQNFTNSARVPEAILYRARAALRQQQIKAATALLTTNAARAGPLADQYQYWLAEAHRQSSNYQAAAEGFARLVRDFPASSLLLEASFGEALARFKLQEWPRVVDLLRNTNSVFQRQSAQRPNDELVIRGHLLLAEALLESDKYSEAGATLSALSGRELIPEFRWRTQYLICRSELAARRATNALAASTNLTALAAATGQRQFVAESVALRGVVLERLGEHEAAIAEYEKNVTEATPAEYRRQALLRIIDQNSIIEAAQKLESFFNQYPLDTASDVALLTLGELNLKRHFASATNAIAGTTNFLQVALGQFDRLITNSPASPFLGKAYLNRGWCFWLQDKVAEAQLDFKAALNRLRRSEDQAVAQFKVGDTQFRLNDFTNAIASYGAVVSNYNEFPRVEDELKPQALFQVLHASLQINDLTAATDAMQQIVRSDSDNPFADRALLLLGEKFTRADRPDEARALFERFLSQYPNSRLRPEVELAIARAYSQEANWEAALQKYENWLQRFSTNELRATAEFNYAHVNSQAGRLTNALNLFTNFLARFPTDTNAPMAKYWVGAFYFDQKQYADAEYQFQDFLRLFQNTNWAVGPLIYEARMMSVRCATARQAYNSAHQYCLDIGNDKKCPPELMCEAFFALGDVLVQEVADPAQPFGNFEQAITAFNKVVQLFPTNSRVPLAWGRIGDCYRQLATQDPKFYDNATNAYYQVLILVFPKADVSTRSQAEVGLGQIMERLAKATNPELWKEAFRHYYNVLLPLAEGEKIDPYWYKEAGLAAARLAEEHQQGEVASRIYEKLAEALPPLRAALQRKIEKVSQ